jgi:hypothetical protein
MLRGFLSLLVALLLTLHLSAAASIAAPATDGRSLVSSDLFINTGESSEISAVDDNNPAPEPLPSSCHDHCAKLMAYTAYPSVPTTVEPCRDFGEFRLESAGVSGLLRPPR